MSDPPKPPDAGMTGPGAILSTLMRWVGRLPLGVLSAMGAMLGVTVFLASPAYRRKLRGNLVVAGYGRFSDAWAAAAQAGRMVGEIPFIWTRPLPVLMSRVVIENVDVLEAAERDRVGMIFLTPHLGAFEITARVVAARCPITVLFKPPKQGWLRPLFELSRNVGALRAVPTSIRGVRAMLRALRAGEAIGLLPDQVPGGGDGRWAPFFGKPAYTMTLPERLAQHPGVRIILTVGERLPGGRGWRIHFEAMSESPTPEAINARMEALIRRWPAQYLWGYNRYKRPAAAGSPD